MQKHIGFLLAVALWLAGCKKNNGNGGVSISYQPLSAGSTWNYAVTGNAAGNFTLTALDRDTSVGGNSYRVFSNSAGPNEYYRKNGSDYFRFAQITELNNQAFELLYLKENLAVGQSWTEIKSANIPVTGFGVLPVTAQFTFAVVARDFDTTISGVTYRKIIRLSATPVFSATVGGAPTNIPSTADIRYYYAANVGLVYAKNQLSVPLAGININTETHLQSYTIR